MDPFAAQYYLAPFDKTQIERFIHMYARSSEADFKDAGACHDNIVTTAGLMELAQTPFVLRLLCAGMSMLLRGRKAQSGTKLARSVTRTDIYANFVGFVAGKQIWRCVRQAFVPLDVSAGRGRGRGAFFDVHDCNRPSLLLTYSCLCHCTQIDIHREIEQFIEALATHLYASRVVQARLEFDQSLPDYGRHLLIEGSPLKVMDTSLSVAFVHKSIMEFLVARAMVQELATAGEKEPPPILRARPIVAEPGVLSFAADMVSEDTTAQRKLFSIVELSKTNPRAAQAAANAASILNMAGVALNKVDMSSARLVGADLRGAVLHNAQLRHCDLRHALLADANLAGASLEQATVYNISFGQLPVLGGDGACAMLLPLQPTALLANAPLASVETGVSVTLWQPRTLPGGQEDLHSDRSLKLPPSEAGQFLDPSLRAMVRLKENEQELEGHVLGNEGYVRRGEWSLPAAVVTGAAWPHRRGVRVAMTPTGLRVAALCRDDQIYIRGEGGEEHVLNVYTNLAELRVRQHHKGQRRQRGLSCFLFSFTLPFRSDRAACPHNAVGLLTPPPSSTLPF